MVARAQNEIYAVLSNDDKDMKMYACTPDSISMVDPTMGMTIITVSHRGYLKGQTYSCLQYLFVS